MIRERGARGGRSTIYPSGESGNMLNHEMKGRRERLGDKVHLAKSFLTLSGKRNMMPGVLPAAKLEDQTSRQVSSGDSRSLSSPARVQPLTLLFLYSRNDNVDALKDLLDGDPKLANAKDYDNRSALHIAATHNCLRAATALLDSGADVNALDRWQNSPLADAAASSLAEMVKLLKSRGGELKGCHGQEFVKSIVPPTLLKSDWEIDPDEINFFKSTKIGKGSFGEIKKVSWRGTPVAVKTILPALSDDKLVVQDFRHEVELLVRTRHPNIVQFLGAVTKRPPLMLITEYLSGGDLHMVIKDSKGHIEAATIVRFALDIAKGMTYLHNGPDVIIHRDLKPRNVLVGEHNQLKVADFGLSKLIKGKTMHDVYKMTGETGSYRYMAPEVFAHKKYDTKVDVYSFAVIVFEMFEGAPPFQNLDAYEAARIAAKEDRRAEFRAKHYPEGMMRLISSCWEPDPAQRPPFKDVIPELEKMIAELSGASREHHHLWPLHRNTHARHASVS